MLDAGDAVRSSATVNRHLAAVFGLYEHHARLGIDVAAGLVTWRRAGRGSYKPLLHHVTKGRPVPTRPVKLAAARRTPRTLRPEELGDVLAAPERARDRFVLALLAETGMRIGQALGLRHADFVSRAKEVQLVPRADNANGARAKLRLPAVIPVTAGLVRAYSLHARRVRRRRLRLRVRRPVVGPHRRGDDLLGAVHDLVTSSAQAPRAAAGTAQCWACLHLATGAANDPAEAMAWSMTEQGIGFNRRSGERWHDADVAAGNDPKHARERADRAITAYTDSRGAPGT